MRRREQAVRAMSDLHSRFDQRRLDEVLGSLKVKLSQTIDEARSLHPGAYHSEAFCELELEALFRRGWICVGRDSELENVGDYLTFEIAGQPVYSVRGDDNEIHTYSNVCLHRLMVLLEGTGNIRRIVCPYHAWCYRPDGQLINAPEMKSRPGFDVRKHRLPELRTEIWQGWIYVALDNHIDAIGAQLEPLEEVIGRYRVYTYEQIDRIDTVWNCNWKCLAENFMESYHLPRGHRGTIGPVASLKDMRMHGGTDHFNYHLITKKPGVAGVAHPDNKHLKDEWRRTTVLATVYPAHFITIAPDYMWYLSLQPRGKDRVQIRYAVALAPEVLANLDEQGKEEIIKDTTELLNRVNEEDRMLVERIFRGSKGHLSREGELCRLELPNLEFYQYLASKLLAD